MTRVRMGTFLTLDISETIVAQSAIKSLLRDAARLPNSDAVKELVEIAKALDDRIDRRLKKVRKP